MRFRGDQTRALRRLASFVIGVSWLGAVGVGLALFGSYANAPGEMQPVPRHWPIESGIPLGNHGPTLVLFAHPRCPCTRATLGELEKLVARYPSKLSVRVVFYKPEGAEDDWERTDLWQTAAAIPGTHLVSDVGGREARRFRAATSGQALLYDVKGELVFNGGITFARGHWGDNAGRWAIEEYLKHGTPGEHQTAVFGCPIADAPASK